LDEMGDVDGLDRVRGQAANAVHSREYTQPLAARDISREFVYLSKSSSNEWLRSSPTPRSAARLGSAPPLSSARLLFRTSVRANDDLVTELFLPARHS
jgi:hypothetical protein